MQAILDDFGSADTPLRLGGLNAQRATFNPGYLHVLGLSPEVFLV
jgi:hypothetical protein